MDFIAGRIGFPPYLHTIPAHKLPAPLFRVPSCFPDKGPVCFAPTGFSNISVTTGLQRFRNTYQQEDVKNAYLIF
jgi:hypothetical protein